MSKRYNIRWKQDDNEALRKAVKNFNAKITRLEKKDPQNKSALPDKVSVKEIKELISTRRDLQRELNALKRFVKRGAEELVDIPDNYYNLKITKWQKKEMTMRASIVNRRRKKQLKDIMGQEVYDRGTPQGYTKGEVGMGRADTLSMQPTRAFTPKMTRHDLNKKNKMLMKESQDAYWERRLLQMKENYIRSLEQNFNPSDIKDIVDKIRDMDAKDFLEIYNKSGLDFDFSYPPDQEAYAQHLSALRTVWSDKTPDSVKKAMVDVTNMHDDILTAGKINNPGVKLPGIGTPGKKG